MKLYNTLARKKETLKPVKPPQVLMYNCGPTVYQFPHIGNWRSFLIADFLKRALNYLGYQTKQVMNITDVGHLTSDADTGQDKVEMEAKKENKTAQEITDFYFQAFVEDGKMLNIIPAQVMPRASEHIAEMIQLVQKLEKKDYTYQTSDGVYFDTSKFKKYGQLSGQSTQEKKAGARIELSPEKRNPTDFALWKFSPKDAKRQQEWPSPWGLGFPGWHLECSALSKKYLGQPFDIHTGGVDHIGVHHENEIAQSEAAHNKPQANIWLHVEFLQINQTKMSKSRGEFLTIKDLVKKGYNPLSYRIFILSAHYQKKQEFSWKAMNQAQKNLEKIYQTARRLNQYNHKGEKPKKINLSSYRTKFKRSIRNNLDAPKILATLFEFLNETNQLIDQKVINLSEARKILDLMIEWDRFLGIEIEKNINQNETVPARIKEMVDQREEMRQQKKWTEADLVRQKIKKLGYQVEDTDQGPKINPI